MEDINLEGCSKRQTGFKQSGSNLQVILGRVIAGVVATVGDTDVIIDKVGETVALV
jgi:hypothetical protein